MKITKEIKIGLYLVVMFVALLWGVSFLKGRDIFGKVHSLYAIYDNVEGLQTTSQVMIKGMKVGTVSKIKLDQKTDKFIVQLQVKSNFVIPQNSVAYLVSNDIMGNKAIRIDLGDDTKHLKDKDNIMSAVEVDMISALTQDLPKIKDSLQRTIDEVKTTFTKVNALLSDQTINDVSKSMAHLSGTLANFEAISANLNRNSGKINTTLSNLESFTTNLNENNGKIDNIITNFSALSDTLKAMKLASTVNEVNTLISQINSGQGTAGKLIYNDSLYNNLSSTLSQLDILLVDFKANPRRYINLSVFGGKAK